MSNPTDTSGTSAPLASPRATGEEIYEAAKAGDAKKVLKIAKKASDPSAVDWNGNRFGRTPLHAACGRGFKDVVETLLKLGADANRVDAGGESPLYAACFGGHLKIVEALLKAKVDVNHADNKGNTPIFVASRGGHRDVVAALLVSGADANIQNNDGWTSLFATAFHGHKDVTEILLSRGNADPNKATTLDGLTPLFIAKRNGHNGVAALISKAGGIVPENLQASLTNIQGGIDQQSSPSAESSRSHSVSMSKSNSATSLPLGTDNKRRGSSGTPNAIPNLLLSPTVFIGGSGIPLSPSPPLISGSVSSEGECITLFDACKNGKREIVENLLKNPQIDVNAVTKGETPLLAAASRGLLEIVEMIVATGQADLSKANMRGNTPVFSASHNGFVKVVEYLVNAGADADQENADGETPLFSAAKNGHEAVVEALLRLGADPSKADESGLTPLYIAAARGNTFCAEMIARAGGKILGKFQQDLERRIGSESLSLLLKLSTIAPPKPPRPPKITSSIFSPRQGQQQQQQKQQQQQQQQKTKQEIEGMNLFQAVENEDLDLIIKLLKEGFAQVDFSGNDFLWTPLYSACRKGNKTIVQALIENGANVNKVNKDGLSPIYIASSKGHLEIVSILIGNGADVNRANKNEWTPVFVATFNGHLKIVELLIKNGADISRLNSYGWSPIVAACLIGYIEIAELLSKNGAVISENFIQRIEKKIGNEVLNDLISNKTPTSSPPTTSPVPSHPLPPPVISTTPPVSPPIKEEQKQEPEIKPQEEKPKKKEKGKEEEKKEKTKDEQDKQSKEEKESKKEKKLKKKKSKEDKQMTIEISLDDIDISQPQPSQKHQDIEITVPIATLVSSSVVPSLPKTGKICQGEYLEDIFQQTLDSKKGSCKNAVLSLEGLLSGKVPQFKTIIDDCEIGCSSLESDSQQAAELISKCRLNFDDIFALTLWSYNIDSMGEPHENLSYQLNEILKIHDGKTTEMKQIADFLFYVLSALKKLPSFSGTVFCVAQNADIAKTEYVSNREVFWSAFTYTTTDIEHAKMHISDKAKGVIFSIKIESGRITSAFSMTTGKDKNVLLPPCAGFIVKNSVHTDSNGYQIIDLIEKPNSFRWC